MSALAPILSQGFDVELAGDHVIVSPASRLTDDLRAYIRDHKPEILRELHLVESALVGICRDYPIAPAEVLARMSSEDTEDWESGVITSEGLRSFVSLLVDIDTRSRGEIPETYTAVTYCRGCGPVPIFPGAPDEVAGCPWCWNRAAGQQVPGATIEEQANDA